MIERSCSILNISSNRCQFTFRKRKPKRVDRARCRFLLKEQIQVFFSQFKDRFRYSSSTMRACQMHSRGTYLSIDRPVLSKLPRICNMFLFFSSVCIKHLKVQGYSSFCPCASVTTVKLFAPAGNTLVLFMSHFIVSERAEEKCMEVQQPTSTLLN